MPSRRSSSRRTKGGPCAGPKTMWSPPITRSRSGLRARIRNSAGARAACARRKPGSKRTVDPSTVWPASRKSSKRVRVVELHADLRREAFGPCVDRAERLLGERLEARHPVHEHNDPFNLQLELHNEAPPGRLSNDEDLGCDRRRGRGRRDRGARGRLASTRPRRPRARSGRPRRRPNPLGAAR